MNQQYQEFQPSTGGYQNNYYNQNANYQYTRNQQPTQEPFSGPVPINEEALTSNGPQPIRQGGELAYPEKDQSKITWVTLRNCSFIRMIQFIILTTVTYVCYLKYSEWHPLFNNNLFGGIEFAFIVLAFVIYYADPHLEKGNITVAGYLLFFIVTVGFIAFFCGLGLQEGTTNDQQIFFISIFLGSTAFADLVFIIVLMISKENYNEGIIGLVAVIVLGAEYVAICAFGKVDWGNCGYAFLGVALFVGYFIYFYSRMKKSQKDKYNYMFYAASKCGANLMSLFAMCFVYPFYWCYKMCCQSSQQQQQNEVVVTRVFIISEYTFF